MKKILSACLALFLLVSLCMSANAAINSGLLHAYYGYDNSNLIALGVPLRKDGTISIALASESEIPAEVSTVAESEFGTTFYCIIDNAYSMSRTAREREIELLKEISNLMGKHDCLVIAASDEAAVISDPLTSPEARQQAIASISFDGKSTDLYSAIRKGLDQLVSHRLHLQQMYAGSNRQR